MLDYYTKIVLLKKNNGVNNFKIDEEGSEEEQDEDEGDSMDGEY